jgi:hypothetical protein
LALFITNPFYLHVIAQQDSMGSVNLRQVEGDVRRAVERLAEQLLSDQYHYVIGSVRRLPRIFDALLPEGALRTALNRKLVYPGCVTLNPKMFEGRSVAVVDDCVQRGISLRDQLKQFHQLGVKNTTLFALANSRWHAEHGQFTGVQLHEPVLTLRPDDFSVLTAYINDTLRNCPIPLDCEDRFIRIDRANSELTPDEWINTYVSALGPIDKLPAPAYSNVRRYSQFFGANHPAANRVSSIQIPGWRIGLDEEIKISWITNNTGDIYCVPIALYSIRKRKKVDSNSDTSRFLREPLRIFADCEKKAYLIYESAALWSSATISGYIQAALKSVGADCSLLPNQEEFYRSYGTRGKEIYTWYSDQLRNASVADIVLPKQQAPTSELPIGDYHQRKSEIHKLLFEHYRTGNHGKKRLNWVPAGLPFRDIRKRLSSPLSPNLISALLDDLLANCWIKSATRGGRTHYFSTELSKQTSSDENLASFSRSGDWGKVQHSALLSRAVIEHFSSSSERPSIPLGYFEHALSALVNCLGNLRSATVFVQREQPHGMIVFCDTHNSLIRGQGTIQQNLANLGIDLAAGRVSLRADTGDPDIATEFTPQALLAIREINEAVSALENKAKFSRGNAILYLSSCMNRKQLFTVLLENIRSIRDGLASTNSARALSELNISAIDHNISGAFDKLNLARLSREAGAAFVGTIKPALASRLFRDFMESSEPDLCTNGWLGVFDELLAEAQAIFSEFRSGTKSLFDEAGEAVEGCEQMDVSVTHEEWNSTVARLGFARDSDFAFPFDKLTHRFKARDLEKDVGFVKIDAARHGRVETDEEREKREEQHFPLFRSLAGFYSGVEARDPEGDALVFAFENPRNALRFAHVATLSCGRNRPVDGRYRIAAAAGHARFTKDGNIHSSTMDIIPDIEKFLKERPCDTISPGASFGSLIDCGLWRVFRKQLKYHGMIVGAESYEQGKRRLPRPVLFAIPPQSASVVTN